MSQDAFSQGMARLTPTVKWLLGLCFGAFVIQQSWDQFGGGHVREWLGLSARSFFFEWSAWQIVTFPFLHHDVLHLFFNLLLVAFTGSELEARWGTQAFVRYAFACSLSGAVAFLALDAFVGAPVPLVGLGPMIFGLLVAYGILYGERTMLLLMLFPMQVKHAVFALMGVEVLTAVFSGRGGLASVANLGGMAGGFVFLWLRARVAARAAGRGDLPTSRRRRSHLKLVSGGEAAPTASPSAGKQPPRPDASKPPGSKPPTWH